MLESLQITTLDNGIKVVTLTNPHAEGVHVGIHARVGSRNETEALNGASHFIEHMLFKGTKKRSAKAISQAIEGQGGVINAYTDKDNTCYFAKVPYNHASVAFDVLGDLFYNAIFDEKELERERSVILEEINMYDDQPDSVAMDQLNRQLWAGHPLGRPILGPVETILNLSRERLMAYRDAQYTPNRTVFAFHGRIRHDVCVRKVEALAGHLKNPKTVREPETFTRAIPMEPFAITRRHIQQTQLAFGWRAPGLNEQERLPTLALLSCVLGESMMSRLFQTIRERKGLCYSIHSGTALCHDCGALIVAAGCDSKKAFSGAQAILGEIYKLAHRPLSAAELRRTRDYLCGRFRLMLDRAPMGWAVGRVLFGFDANPAAVLDGYRAVTSQDVQALAAELFTPHRTALSVVAPESVRPTDDAWEQLATRALIYPGALLKKRPETTPSAQ